jgi:hypothetical protein
MNFNSTSSVIFKKYWFQGRLFLGAGVSFNIEKNVNNTDWNYGGGLIINVGGNF